MGEGDPTLPNAGGAIVKRDAIPCCIPHRYQKILTLAAQQRVMKVLVCQPPRKPTKSEATVEQQRLKACCKTLNQITQILLNYC